MDRVMIAVVICALVPVTTIAANLESSDAPTIQPAALQAAREAGAAPLVLDVRTPAEYATGHIPGALNIPYDQVPQRLAKVEGPNGVVVYCMVGPRARKGEAALLAAGYAPVFHLEGGLAAWQAAGLPVEHTK